MPKVDIDYSNTIFYKIFCKDSALKELYVGLTTNFVQRRHAHKQSCKNEKASNHNCKLYNTIRNAGGWDNWQMEIIAFHNCADSYEAHKKEHEYFEQLGATLNSIDPLPKPKIHENATKIVTEKPNLFCEPCKVYFSNWKAQDTHNHTKKHNRISATVTPHNMDLNNAQKNADDLNCTVCHFVCCKKSDWDRHISTRKHKNRTNVNAVHSPTTEQLFVCECGKKYTARNSLWYHEKKCKGVNLNSYEEINEDKCESEVKLLTNMVLAVVKQNQEILKGNTELKNIIMDTQTQMIKVLENGTKQNNKFA